MKNDCGSLSYEGFICEREPNHAGPHRAFIGRVRECYWEGPFQTIEELTKKSLHQDNRGGDGGKLGDEGAAREGDVPRRK